MEISSEAATQAKVVEARFVYRDRRHEGGTLGGAALRKAYLVARLQTLLQTNHVHLPPSAEARILVEELLGYERRLSEDANDRYGAFRVGTQDDLVTALGLALQDDGPRRAIILGG